MQTLPPCRVAWVGDYAYSADGLNIPDGIDVAKLHEIAWGDNSNTQEIHKDELYLDGKYLVNHTKKIYLNCDDYKLRSNNCGWVIHPLPLLTAIGNGLGGGDYYGINIKLAVGLGVQYPLKMIFRLGIKNLNVHSEKIKTALL